MDDDKSLNDLDPPIKERLVLTEAHKGLDREKRELTLKKIRQMSRRTE